MLREIGRQLDSDIYPVVKIGGVVAPSVPAEHKPLLGEKELINERQRQGRPETGPRAGTTRGQGQAERGGSPNSAPSFWGTDLQVKYEGELSSIEEAYPNTEVWHQSDGLWLLSESTLLPGLQRKALFLTGIPFDKTRVVQSWGFWAGIPLKSPVWIGPRHTNFPHGSVCAFCPNDNVWNLGDPIVTLLDLYTLWAFRQLHLQELGRWPGRQAAEIPYERITELKENEFCGCGKSDKLYKDCCKKSDLNRNLIEEYNYFIAMTGGVRKPPEAVLNFVSSKKEIPILRDLLPEFPIHSKRFYFRRDGLDLAMKTRQISFDL